MDKFNKLVTPREIYYQPNTEFVAKFVGKANLIKGEWINESTFRPDYNTDHSLWININTSPYLKAKNLCPIRPEQFTLSTTG